MGNANVRRFLAGAEMWRAVWMVEQGFSHLQSGVIFGVDHTPITRALVRYQKHGPIIRRHGRGRQRATTASED